MHVISKVHTNSGKQTIAYTTTIPWNNIPTNLKDLNTLNFSKHLKIYSLSEQHSEINCKCTSEIKLLLVLLLLLLLSLLLLLFGTAVKCPSLSAPPNGILQGCEENTKGDYLKTCRFSCSVGYIPSGSEVRTCLRNSRWSGEDFSCRGILRVP